MNALPLPVPPTLAPGNNGTGIGVILRNIAALIARRFLHDPFHAALIIPLWQHLTRAALRLDLLLARLAAGPIPHLPTLDPPPKSRRRPWWLPPPRKRTG